jgi:hypothetical protein
MVWPLLLLSIPVGFGLTLLALVALAVVIGGVRGG